MEPMSSSGSETPTPLTDTAGPARLAAPFDAVLIRMRSRRVQTFALGALVGALGLSLVVVVTTIFAAAQQSPSPLPAAPATEMRSTPSPAPTLTRSPPPTVDAGEETTDAAPDDGRVEPGASEPVIEPAPAPSQIQSPPAAVEPDAPGRSGSAPGKTKEPKNP
ncbi:hypothetical protein HF576_11340 [Microbacterium sp. CFH 90308]|uniref:Uncharacterized protein n=1 Tax=Microbacterium salsuginis TaxID=2722803 RepID=A0ABX1KDK2_9MICO|nr:hypothetical protein [Microbacterium sp. CFH 90308]NLP84445.1 hypothetical protein [Microbacterium sp. CFH 90308]